MADRREELSPGSPSKRPRLDLEESHPEICDSNERRISTVTNSSSQGHTNDCNDDISGPNVGPSSSTSDRVEGSQFGSASGAVFEIRKSVSDQASVVSASVSVADHEASGTDQNVTDSSYLELHDTLADISEIPSCSHPSCSQTMSTSQTTSTSLSESHQEIPGENEPSSSQISDSSSSGGGAMTGSAKPGVPGSSTSSPNNASEGSDDSDLDLQLGSWQPEPPSGPMGWLQRQMLAGADPRSILCRMLPGASNLPDDMSEFEMWSLIIDYFRMLQDPPRRKKLDQFNTFDDALQLLRTRSRILVLTGAGVSVSCGIPDFRSRDGIYARLAVDFPDLPDPQAMFDINYFRRDPRPFYKFAKEIYPGQFRPSTSHKFISVLEQQGKLLRNYTQNIDTLEQVAGITRVVQCHGSFATAKCTNCGYKVDSDAIREDIFNQVVPPCPRCPQDTGIQSVMKPEIVFFGEGLPSEFYHSLEDDKDNTDLLIVIGSSLKVRPVATIPSAVPAHVPQILINREPLSHMTFDIELLGDGDVIINELCRRLGYGWNHICHTVREMTETTELPESPGTAALEQEEQAGIDFENMPTPPVVDQLPNVNQAQQVAQRESHLAEASGADGVSSSSDATRNGQQEGLCKDTNEAEAAGPNMEEKDNSGCALKVVQESDHFTENAPSNSESTSTGSTAIKTAEVANGVDSSTEQMAQGDSVKKNKLDSSKGAASSTVGRTTGAECENTLKQEPPEKADDIQTKSTTDQDNISKHDESTIEQSRGESSSKGEQQEQEGSALNVPEQGVNLDSALASENNLTDIAGTSKDVTDTSERRGDQGEQTGGSSSEPRQSEATNEEHPRPVKKKRRRSSIGTYLLPSTYLFVPPNRYIFHGAEVYPPSECSDDGGDAEAKGHRLDSSSDQLGLDQVNPATLDSSGDLSDPFYPDQKELDNLGRSKPFGAVEHHSADQASFAGTPDNSGQAVLDGTSTAGLFMPPAPQEPLGLGAEGQIELPPLELSGAVGVLLPEEQTSGDQPSEGSLGARQSAVNFNGGHSIQQTTDVHGQGLPQPSLATTEGSTESHSKDDTSTAKNAGLSHSKQIKPNLLNSGGTNASTFKEDASSAESYSNIQTVVIAGSVNGPDLSQGKCHDGSHDRSHDTSSDMSHDRSCHKPCSSGSGNAPVLPNGATHHKIPQSNYSSVDEIKGNDDHS